MIKSLTLLPTLIMVLICLSPATAQVKFYRGERLCTARHADEKLVFNAVNRNDEPLLKKFLRNGGDPNATDDCGMAVIFYAAQPGRLALLKQLVKAGADVNAIDTFDQKQPLLWLIDSSGELSDSIEGSDYAELYNAVKFLLENGARVNLKIKSSKSALIQAVMKRHPYLVELLIAFGAEVNFRDGEDRTAYSYAAQFGDKKLKRILLKAGADPKIGVAEYQKNYGENAFFQASADGRTDIIESMLASGTDVNMVNQAGNMSALMRTFEESTVDALLAAGADVNLKDKSGHTALMWAVLFQLKSIVEKLIAAGADLNTRNDEGKSVLDLAADSDIKAILIKSGAK